MTTHASTILSTSQTLTHLMLMTLDAAAAKSRQSCPTLATPWTAAYQAPLSMGFHYSVHGKSIGVGCHYLLRTLYEQGAIMIFIS